MIAALSRSIRESILAGRIAHGFVRADLIGHQLQIEEGCAADDGDQAEARVEADALFLQKLHGAVACFQAVSAAAGQHDSVDLLHSVHRLQQFRLPGGRAAAPYVHAGESTLLTKDDGAAGGAFRTLRVTHAEPFHFRQFDLLHGKLPFYSITFL